MPRNSGAIAEAAKASNISFDTMISVPMGVGSNPPQGDWYLLCLEYFKPFLAYIYPLKFLDMLAISIRYQSFVRFFDEIVDFSKLYSLVVNKLLIK